MPRIERDGLEISYDDLGSGRAIVLLHGLLFSSEMWAPLAEQLSIDHRVITVDLRGHGNSSRVEEPFTLYDLVSDVVAVLDACDVRRAVWIGSSLGGMVALRAAIVVPEAVDALVLLDTDAGTETALNRLRYRAMSLGATVVGIGPFIPVVTDIAFGGTTRRDRPELVHEWTRRFAELDARSMRHALEAVVRRDALFPLLHEIDAPALVVVGDEDETFPSDVAARIARGIAGARLEIVPAAGHTSATERPDHVGDLVAEFLRSSGAEDSELDDEERVEQDSDSAADDVGTTDVVETVEPGGAEPPPVGPDTEKVEADPEASLDEDSSVEAAPGEAETVEPDPSSVDAGRERFETYEPEPDGGTGEAREFVRPGGKSAQDRRGKRRVSPSRKLYGRIGHVGILLVDISESGARIEHYDRRFQTGSTVTLEVEWETRTLRAECQVMSSRVHRFIAGDKGATVYQSGLLFQRMNAESRDVVKELVGRLVTRGLAEQVANARGIGPVLQNDMPTFRSGVVDVAGRDKNTSAEGPIRLIKENPAMGQTGFVRCRKIGARWEKKWTIDPKQPKNGFTVLASENKLEIEMLCETWDHGDEDAKRFIRDCARVSIRTALGTDGEPNAEDD